MIPTQKDLENMLDELLDLESGLTAWEIWEIEFLDSLKQWDGDFTEKQALCLEKIWNKRM